jgi:tRNA pseudouridine(38-40) synthase
LVSRLVLEYDGAGFAGWAKQPGLRTVQAEVERALGVILRLERVDLTVAGRTDAGVHAWGQVASYVGPPVSVRSVNAVLPSDTAVLSCSEAGPGFDARRDATSRAYCYRILLRRPRSAFEHGRALWWPRSLDFSALSRCARALVGVHDFTAFTPTETEHVRFSRDVFAAFWRWGGGAGDGGRSLLGLGGPAGMDSFAIGGPGGAEGARPPGSPASPASPASPGSPGSPGPEGGHILEFWIEADAFMRQMIRVLIGTMLEVGAGRRSVASFVELLDGRPRSAAGRTAPAHGLYLAGVGYGGERVLSV